MTNHVFSARFARALIGILISVAGLNATPLGSYTLTYPDRAPDGTKIHVSGRFGIPPGGGAVTSFEFDLNISGLTSQQATTNLLAQLKDQGTDATNNDGSINVTNRKGGALLRIDGGPNMPGFGPSLDGTVPTSLVKPGEKWTVAFASGIDSGTVTTSGVLTLAATGTSALNVVLAAGTTPDEAAALLGSSLISHGFPDVSIDTSAASVSFFGTPSGSPVGSITALSFSGANLNYAIDFPAEIPEPSTLWTVAVTLAISALLYRGKRET